MTEREKQYPIDILTAFAERTVKRLWVIIILLIVMLVATNAGWIWYNAQFEDVTTTTQEVTQDVETGEGSAIISGIGDVYGEGYADGQGDNNQDQNP